MKVLKKNYINDQSNKCYIKILSYYFKAEK